MALVLVDTSFIWMSVASERTGAIERCYNLGCNALFTKSMDYAEFSDTLKTLADFIGLASIPAWTAPCLEFAHTSIYIRGVRPDAVSASGKSGTNEDYVAGRVTEIFPGWATQSDRATAEVALPRGAGGAGAGSAGTADDRLSCSFDTPKTVLIVEDQPLLRHMLTMYLENFGFLIMTAETGDEGWDQFGSHGDTIDLVILDLRMPGPSGEQLLMKFQSERPDLPVIITSGLVDDDSYKRIKASGAFALLPKPFEITDLHGLLMALFGSG